jgi:hypothetical protein
MRNLFLFVAGAILMIHCTACRVKNETNKTLNTSWQQSEGELKLTRQSLPITVYQMGTFGNRQLTIVAPFKEGQYELTVPYSSVYTFTLPNHTQVSLNSGSRLLFDLTSTIMHLDGEAWVYSPETAVTVYAGHHEFVHGEQGASFNISNYSDYASENEIETVLLGGTIIMNSRNFRDTIHEVGVKVVCDKTNLSKVVLCANPTEVVSWTGEGLQYSDIPLKKLLHKIGRRYGLQISGEDNIDSKNVSYTGSDKNALEKNLKNISDQYPNCTYLVKENRLNVYDLAWVVGGTRAAYFQ